MRSCRRVSLGIVMLCLAAGTVTAQARNGAKSCVTVVDAGTGHAVAMARIAPTESALAALAVASTDPAGRACLDARDSTSFRIDAVGYVPVDRTLGTAAAPRVTLRQIPASTMLPEWGISQIRAGLTEAVDLLSASRDVAAMPALRDVLRRMEAAAPNVTVSSDSTGVLLLGYVDLASDGSRYSEMRMRFNAQRSIVLGITTQHCTDACAREREVAISWVPGDSGGWRPEFAALRDTSGVVTRIALDGTAPVAMAVVQAAREHVTNVHGVLTDLKGTPLPGIEVFSADGSASVLSDAKGAYRIAVPMPQGGALITTRRLGWEPTFRLLTMQDGEAVEWNPSLKSTAVLAREVVRANALPEALRSFRYNDFLARRERGNGQFFITEEIWSAVSLGDMLRRARGFRPNFTYGSNLKSIRVPRCEGPGGYIVGVYVNGRDETDFATVTTGIVGGVNRDEQMENEQTAVRVLAQFVNSAIVGMELYIGHAELPAEYANPKYCAVIGLWTR